MNKQDYDTIKQALEELSHIESNSGCNDNDKSPTALDTLERVFSEQDSIISKLSQKIDNQNERN